MQVRPGQGHCGDMERGGLVRNLLLPPFLAMKRLDVPDGLFYEPG